MNRSIPTLTFLLVLLAGPVFGQTGALAKETNWSALCARSLKEPLTLPKFSPAMPQSELEHCDSSALYYGFGKPADPAAALQCAYYQRAHPRPGVGDPFYGPGVLTMIYANGRGASRNFNLAIRFACENEWAAGAEQEFRIGHLEQLRDQHASSTNFDLCDDATSGLMQGACESVQQSFADAKRRERLDALSANWSPQVKDAFKGLQRAQVAFVEARVRREVDLSGTGRVSFMLVEEGRLEDQFLIDLRHFATGFSPASTADYQVADRKLNIAYGRLMSSPESAWQYGTIKPDGIRETERNWLKLREAWVDFARLAYPQLSADTIRTQITRLRIHQLQSLLPAG